MAPPDAGSATAGRLRVPLIAVGAIVAVALIGIVAVVLGSGLGGVSSTGILLAALGAVGVGVLYWALSSPRPIPDSEWDVEAPEPAEPKQQLSLRERLSRPLASMAAPALRGRRGSDLQAQLSRAGINMRTYEFVIIQVSAAAIIGLLAFLRFGNPLLFLAGAGIGWFLPGMYVRRRQRQRKGAFEAVLGDTIVLMSNGVKAGYSIQQAMNSVAESGRPPLAEEVARIIRETALGIDLEAALEHANRRLDSKDFDMVVTALLIHRKVGGNLAEVLDKIAETIRERVRVQGEVRVLTAQARASGYIITGLPFAVAGILSLISPQFERPLFTNSLGWVMIAVALVMIGIGYAIISRITDIHL